MRASVHSAWAGALPSCRPLRLTPHPFSLSLILRSSRHAQPQRPAEASAAGAAGAAGTAGTPAFRRHVELDVALAAAVANFDREHTAEETIVPLLRVGETHRLMPLLQAYLDAAANVAAASAAPAAAAAAAWAGSL